MLWWLEVFFDDNWVFFWLLHLCVLVNSTNGFLSPTYLPSKHHSAQSFVFFRTSIKEKDTLGFVCVDLLSILSIYPLPAKTHNRFDYHNQTHRSVFGWSEDRRGRGEGILGDCPPSLYAAIAATSLWLSASSVSGRIDVQRWPGVTIHRQLMISLQLHGTDTGHHFSRYVLRSTSAISCISVASDFVALRKRETDLFQPEFNTGSLGWFLPPMLLSVSIAVMATVKTVVKIVGFC